MKRESIECNYLKSIVSDKAINFMTGPINIKIKYDKDICVRNFIRSLPQNNRNIRTKRRPTGGQRVKIKYLT